MGSFRIGLTMAGAISAGAYTAGVFDFLIQALAAWEEEKKRNPAVTPGHEAPIVAMTGASAGGMTAALGAIALGRGLRSTRKGSGDREVTCVLPDLYSSWVEQVRMVSDVGMDLLSGEDLADGSVLSLLNSRLLDHIKDLALAVPQPPPAVEPYPFLADPLHVYVTLTNLRGVQYDINFAQNMFRMLNHADRKHFRIEGLGCNTAVASAWSKNDPPASLTALCLRDLNQPGGAGAGWKAMGDAAVATGAFPVGLAARQIATETDEYTNRPWPVADAGNNAGNMINPSWPKGFGVPDPKFSFVAVDGGAINNEPFELARFAIMDQNASWNSRSSWEADRAVIMVAPFPEGYSFPVKDPAKTDFGLVSVIKALFPTMIQQARFKADELVAAAKPDVRSRFLIAPKRMGSDTVSSKDIACGLLGGFGGFLDQSFREHDFKLGQRNCQQFLRQYFNLHVNSKVFGGDGSEPADKTKEAPIIPLVGSVAVEIPEPIWPQMSMASFETLMKRIEARADELVPLLSHQEIKGRLLRSGVRLMWNWSAKDSLMQVVRCAILSDLIRRNQIEDGMSTLSSPKGMRLGAFSAEQREILAVLAGSSAELRTIPSLARETGIAPDTVFNTLSEACGVDKAAVHAVWLSDIKDGSGQYGYALQSRKPNLLETLPLVGGMIRKVSGIKID